MTRASIFLVTTLTVTIAAPQSALAQTKVAVVSISDVSEKYQKTADLEARFEVIRQKANEKRHAIQDRIDRAKRSLQEELKPGTDAYRARLKELAMLDTELKWFSEVEGQRIEEGLADSLREIFDDIRGAVSAVATEHELDIVIANDKLPQEGRGNPDQVRRQILLQKVLYWRPNTDITQEVISRLNADYKGPDSPGAERNTAPTTDDHR